MTDERESNKKQFLKNRVYGLLCEREKQGDWEEFLDTILVELLKPQDCQQSNLYYQLYSKLAMCKYLRYEFFRKNIFESMNLIDRIDVNELF